MLGSLQDVYVAVMGVTGAGKSTFIEKLTGKEVNIGHGLFSCKYFSPAHLNTSNTHYLWFKVLRMSKSILLCTKLDI